MVIYGGDCPACGNSPYIGFDADLVMDVMYVTCSLCEHEFEVNVEGEQW
jgi:formate dehydrogenase maturation protein FdhE